MPITLPPETPPTTEAELKELSGAETVTIVSRGDENYPEIGNASVTFQYAGGTEHTLTHDIKHIDANGALRELALEAKRQYEDAVSGIDDGPLSRGGKKGAVGGRGRGERFDTGSGVELGSKHMDPDVLDRDDEEDEDDDPIRSGAGMKPMVKPAPGRRQK